ncbi:hypothetical protein FSP39_010934 [Pinctada imbricata]|uniref:Protein HIRA n=1 Tax=Pinctada imbricata TaxID=66713 RepID=A0AA89BVQ4_PINIB|nr:hypothetical protein FSP39_010934 [Pinctada imbricata]
MTPTDNGGQTQHYDNSSLEPMAQSTLIPDSLPNVGSKRKSYNFPCGKPIFSIDIHPDGSRVATGGQGEDSGKVAIWNMGPIRDEKEENDENIPKVLCQMNNHLACVNCVRWSNSGKSLASGGDDKLIMIWQTSRYSAMSGTFGGGSIVEQWRPAATLRGHTGDVLDLAWSGNDSWLASCSVDNTIVIWNADKFPEQIKVLKGHNGLVKGVTWDPVGKYLASQSDDKSVKIWRTRDWQEENKITEPFQECGGTTHVLRLNWSPDGAYVVSAHAMNNSGPTAQIIEREGWKASLDFVGHRKAVTVVRFNPNIFSKKIKKGAEQSQQYTCCAIGSRDRSLSVWLTALKRPLVVTHDLFDNSILDITWSKSGLELMACSCDGTVAFIEFSVEEIGISMSQNDVQKFLETIYGKCMTKSNSTTNGNLIIESAELLKLQQQQQQKREEIQRKMSIMSDSLNDSHISNMSTSTLGSPFKPKDKQIETKTADGRRRITPVFLEAQIDVNVGEAPLPFTCKSGGIQFTSTKEVSKIVVEKQNIITKPGLASPSSRSSLSQSFTSPTTGNQPPNKESTPSPTQGNLPPNKESTPKSQHSPSLQDKDLDKSKKESPQEQKPSSETRVMNVSIQPMASLQSKLKTKSHDKNKSEKTKSVFDSPHKSDKLKDRMKLAGGGIKRKHDGDKERPKLGRPKKTDKDRMINLLSSPVSTRHEVHIGDRDTVRYVSQAVDLKLPVPSPDKTFNKIINGKLGDPGCTSLEVENNINVGGHTLHKVKCVMDGIKKWEQVTSARILAVAGSRHFACAACEDCTVNVYLSNGSRCFPAIVLQSKVSRLHAQGHHLMVITHRGYLWVWNIQRKQAVIHRESLSPILSGTDALGRSHLTSEGVPMVTIHHKSYTFSEDMSSWLLLYSKGDTITQCSDHHSCMPVKESSKSHGPLASVQPAQERLGMQASRVFGAGHSLQQLSTLSHIESQMASCIMLKSPSEYKFWLQTYIRYLSQEGMESKLRAVCDDLLGPVYKTKGRSAWESHLLGISKRELLRDILPNIGSNLKLQRLFTEYQEQLEL